MLALDGLRKTFHQGTPDRRAALDGVSLALRPGDFAVVIGGNGAGKSTLLNAIAGEVTPDEGSVSVDGVDVTRKPTHIRAAWIARVFQDPLAGTAGTLTVAENLSIAERRGKTAEQARALLDLGPFRYLSHFITPPSSPIRFTARFFLGPDGAPDRTRIDRRKHSLARWLRETAQAALTHDFAYYLLSVGLAHSHRDHGPGGKIPPQFMVAAMSLTQTALARIFRDELGDPAAALDAAVAWNKLLLLHLNVLLIGYLLPPRKAS